MFHNCRRCQTFRRSLRQTYLQSDCDLYIRATTPFYKPHCPTQHMANPNLLTMLTTTRPPRTLELRSMILRLIFKDPIRTMASTYAYIQDVASDLCSRKALKRIFGLIWVMENFSVPTARNVSFAGTT
jgi:hypothetical protein